MTEVIKVEDCGENIGDYDVQIYNAILIPENATNGDMIKALYGEPAKIGRTGVLYKFKYKNGKPMFSTYFDLDWWNSPYERK